MRIPRTNENENTGEHDGDDSAHAPKESRAYAVGQETGGW